MPIRSIKKEEFEELIELLEASFHNADKDHRFYRLYKEKPLIEPWGRVYDYIPGVDSGLPLTERKFIAFCDAYSQEIQYGHSRLLNAGLRSVSTHPIARGKGFGLKLLKDTRSFLFQQHADLSILFSGADHFYEKNGWRRFITRSEYILAPKDYKAFKENIINSPSDEEPQFTVSFLEDDDIPALTELYNSSNEGLYFSAYRSEEYWKAHFSTIPSRKYEYFVIKSSEGMLAYFCISFNYKESGIELNIKEARLTPAIAKIGNPLINQIFIKTLDFVIEESLDEEDPLEAIVIQLNLSNPLIKHFLYERLNIKEQKHTEAHVMFLITDPYSLFSKLKREFEARFIQGMFPTGIFSLQFDTLGEFPGGLIIDTRGGEYKQQIISTEEEWKELHKKENIEDCAIFTTISDLTLLFAGIIDPYEIDMEDLDAGEKNIEDTDLKLVVKGKGLRWLEAMFSDITYDFYKLDHY